MVHVSLRNLWRKNTHATKIKITFSSWITRGAQDTCFVMLNELRVEIIINWLLWWLGMSGDLSAVKCVFRWRRTKGITLSLLLVTNNIRIFFNTSIFLTHWRMLLTQELIHLWPLCIFSDWRSNRGRISFTYCDGIPWIWRGVLPLLSYGSGAFGRSYTNSSRNILCLSQFINGPKVVLHSLVLVFEHGFH